MKIKISPSYKPEIVKMISVFITIIIVFLLDYLNIANYNLNLSKILSLPQENNIYDFVKEFNIYYIVNLILFFYVCISIFKKSFFRFYFKYMIDEENGFLIVKSGIIKSENSISIKEIRTINIPTPNIWQLFIGVRDIKIESDGVEGWDAILIDVANAKNIEEKLFQIKRNLQNMR